MARSEHPREYILRWLEARIARVRAHRIVAKAIIDGRQAMAKPVNLPNLAGVTSAFDKLRHGIEARADKMLKRVEAIDAKADTVFKNADAKLDAHDQGLGEIDHYLDALDHVGNGFTESSEGSSDGKS
jgi:hypothetical protein